jgi:hypothetical protein
MSGASAKAERREVRRTVGEEATQAIEKITQAVNSQILPNLNTLAISRDNHEHRIRLGVSTCEDRWTATAKAQKRIFDTLHAIETLTFAQRLRWLFTGRLPHAQEKEN